MFSKVQAYQKMKKYLDANNIENVSINDSGTIVLLEDTILHLVCPADRCISRCVEQDIIFGEEYLLVKAFYATVFAKEKDYADLFHLINYINANVAYHSLLDCRLALDEKYGDIFIRSKIPVTLLETMFQEVMDFILNFNIQMLSDIAIPLCAVCSGDYDIYMARRYIDCYVMGEKAY